MKALCGKVEINYFYDTDTKKKTMSLSFVTNISKDIGNYKLGDKFTLQVGTNLYSVLILSDIVDSDNGKLGHFTGEFECYQVALDKAVIN